MRFYHGQPSPNQLRQAREAAPSHVHGACWVPDYMTPHEFPYFVDNGAFTSDFDPGEWLAALDALPDKMPYAPDFVVLPDVLNDAQKTLARHREFIPELRDRHLQPAPVLQPGLSVETQIGLYDRLNVNFLFVGGECRWQRTHGTEIIERAHNHGINVHVGNPGGKDAVVWWAREGVDSVDTSSVLQNNRWDWLENLEDTSLSKDPLKKGRQSDFGKYEETA